MKDPEQIGKVLAIAVRTGVRQPMRTVQQARAQTGGGLEGDIEVTRDRGITLLASQQWEQVMRELNRDLPWHTRRANVLVETASLGHLIGRTITLGDLIVSVTGETRPCQLMESQCPGLLAALRPEVRGGVHGEVLQGGRLAVGDTVRVLTEVR